MTAKTLLIRNADVVAFHDDQRRELANASLYIRGGVIEAIGATADMLAEADEVINATGHVVIPGLVNTHHHRYQSLPRAMPASQNASLLF